MTTNVCIAIAVAHPEGLDELPGAVPSAKRFAAWATSQGYTVELITDEANNVVTCERLADAFRRHLGRGGQNRVIVSFAGHGLIRGGSEEYWLLNDWRTRATEAVNHLKLRDRLGTYLPRQIAVVSDACRSLTTDRAKWVEGNGVVDVQDYVERPVQVAQLSGTRSAQPAFATPLGADEAYCFFTQVVTNALTGTPEEVIAMDAEGRRVVLNDRLFAVVERELPLLASRYGRRQVTDLQGSWRSPPDSTWSVLPERALPQPPRLDAPPPPPRGMRGFAPRLIDDSAAVERMQKFKQRLRTEARATHFETGTGLVVTGATVTEIAVDPRFRVEPDRPDLGWYRLLGDGTRSTAVAVCLANQRWVAAAVYQGFIGTFSIGEDGADSYVLRPSGDDTDIAEVGVATAVTGGVSDPFKLATQLRERKHADPVLGALAAYAYARAGAIEDIRRLCHFYVEEGQPVPFDAVLLARVPVQRVGLDLFAEIPSVSAREPRNELEEEHEYSYRGTAGGLVTVAGSFPWLRQGWALLDDDFRTHFRRLSPFAQALLPTVFTTLSSNAGRELATKIRRGEF